MRPFFALGWQLVNTSKKCDSDSAPYAFGHCIKPDGSLYSEQGEETCRVKDMESFIEIKWAPSDEPFTNIPLEPTVSNAMKASLEREGCGASDTRGQLSVYANAIQAAQHRTRVFGIYIWRSQCRLLCHSRSGTIVTPRFDYTNTTHLQEFLWRFSHASPEERGHDTSVERLLPQDPLAEPARTCLLLNRDAPLFKIAVHQAEGDRADHVVTYYIVSEPLTSSFLYPTGRGMRGYLAFDCQSRVCVFLKDAWRLSVYDQEGVVYERLRECQVEHISQVVAHGDVPGNWQSCGTDTEPYASSSTFREHVHYRIVLRIVGQALSSFGSTHELVTAVYDALVGSLSFQSAMVYIHLPQ